MTSPVQRHQLFISYSHQDGEWLKRLQTMLKPLERSYGLQHWDDTRIEAGATWREDIEQALATARVALLLVSADFLASDFVTREELPLLFQAAERDGLRILWVPLRPCVWELIPEIEQYQAVIPPDRALAEMEEVEQEITLAKLVKDIYNIFREARPEEERQPQLEEVDHLAREQADVKRNTEEEPEAREHQERDRQQVENEQKSRCYEKGFSEPIATQYPRDAVVAEGLMRYPQELDLSDGDVARNQDPWIASREAARVAREQAEAERKAQEEILAHEQAPLPLLPLHPISVTSSQLLREGNRWRQQRTTVEVEGYEEELAPGVAITMLRIPAGTFLMGSPEGEEGRIDDESPQHPVHVREFFLGQTPITQAQWKVVAGWEKVEHKLNNDLANFKGERRPVEQVLWHEAVEFCLRLSRRTGRRYGLPSEAQWEYACRAGTTTPFHFGDTLTEELANYDSSSFYGGGPKGTYRKQTTDVGTFPANSWGLKDMHGTVWEWCEDHWHDGYDFAPDDGGAWLIPGADVGRVLRGGSWGNDPRFCRSACRNSTLPVNRRFNYGFRVCCLPPGPSSTAPRKTAV